MFSAASAPQSVIQGAVAVMHRQVAVAQGELVQGAKLHVLGLEPIKEKLGPKWNRLSDLVHRLMKKSIIQAQGPHDHFVVLDELYYAVTFARLSQAETGLMCNAIAREVSEILFGDQVNEISVRTVIATIPAALTGPAVPPRALEASIEERGVASVVRCRAPALPAPASGLLSPAQRIAATHAAAEAMGLSLHFVPLWDLERRTSNAVYACLMKPGNGKQAGRALFGHTREDAAEMELALLFAAEAYGALIAARHEVRAVSAGISYETLLSLRSRIRFITQFQKCEFAAHTPLILRIVEIPHGVPDGRIAEQTAMLRRPTIKIALQFQHFPPRTRPAYRRRRRWRGNTGTSRGGAGNGVGGQNRTIRGSPMRLFIPGRPEHNAPIAARPRRQDQVRQRRCPGQTRLHRI